MLFAQVDSVEETRTFVVVSTTLFFFEVRFCLTYRLVVIYKTIQALLNLISTQTNRSDSFSCSIDSSKIKHYMEFFSYSHFFIVGKNFSELI